MCDLADAAIEGLMDMGEILMTRMVMLGASLAVVGIVLSGCMVYEGPDGLPRTGSVLDRGVVLAEGSRCSDGGVAVRYDVDGGRGPFPALWTCNRALASR